ncbi:MAG: hypothetical protein H6740_20790 [Alphaproteobacteria bacterium]|nr:hypothetical protein [Alphaproteobacteria bacterium]
MWMPLLLLACAPKAPPPAPIAEAPAAEAPALEAPAPAGPATLPFPSGVSLPEAELRGGWIYLQDHPDQRWILREGEDTPRPLPPATPQRARLRHLLPDGAVVGVEHDPVKGMAVSEWQVVVREPDGAARWSYGTGMMTTGRLPSDAPSVEASGDGSRFVLAAGGAVTLLDDQGAAVWQRDDLPGTRAVARIREDGGQVIVFAVEPDEHLLELSPETGETLAAHSAGVMDPLRPSEVMDWVDGELLVSRAQGMSAWGNGRMRWADGALERCASDVDGFGFMHLSGQTWLVKGMGFLVPWQGCAEETGEPVRLTPPVPRDTEGVPWVYSVAEGPGGVYIGLSYDTMYRLSEDLSWAAAAVTPPPP